MNEKLRNQVALVTGASSGIGAGVSGSLARAGAIVAINYPGPAQRNAAENVLAEIRSFGGRGMTVQADVSREEEVMDMFGAVIRQFGTIDILVNNAGIQKDAAFEKMSLSDWNMVLGINLTGQFLCAREAIREFLRRGPA